MKELEEKEEGYDNAAFEKGEEIPHTPKETSDHANEPNTIDTDKLQDARNLEIERLQLESRAGLPEKTVITDREAGDHNWHEVKSI